jgi:hypothetical protein
MKGRMREVVVVGEQDGRTDRRTGRYNELLWEGCCSVCRGRKEGVEGTGKRKEGNKGGWHKFKKKVEKEEKGEKGEQGRQGRRKEKKEGKRIKEGRKERKDMDTGGRLIERLQPQARGYLQKEGKGWDGNGR